MADVNANIDVNIDTSAALAQLKSLQRQISQFHSSIAKSSEAASLAQRDLQRNFINSINSTGAFSAELRTIKTTAESFTDSLQKNKFSMREYFRFAGGATKTFGRLFKSEFDTVSKVAEENVKRLQTQYIKMGRDASGAMRAIAIMPNELDMSKMSTQMQIAAQRQAIFNQLVKQGSTNLLNFGKNTQWAGRQLMVGFTLPLATLGTVASRTFMDMETAALKFRKVYGDLFTPTEEREQALADIQALGESFTKYGIAVSQTVGLAAEAAAAGFQGLDLQRQVTEATRLQVLGQVDQQKALETTISLQNAFQMSSADLADSINFLNAVENQTVVSLDDITTAIPKAAPVVKQLGGNVKDLAFFMAAMKEGGINASEGANALKSGLASLINPTDKATEMMKGFGIDIDAIVNKNAGNVKQTVIEFAQALDNLSNLNRQRAIEQLFGKFQLARLSTLFENVTKDGNQASRVLDLATASVEDLAAMSESELGMTADSAMNKFRKTVEDLKLALVPVGQTFLEAMTPIVEFIGGILEKFNDLPKGVKKALTIITVAIGAIGPVALMTFGLLANGLANIIKFAAILRNGYLRLTGQSQILGEQTQFLTVEQQNALAVAHSLDQSHARLTQTFNVERTSLDNLTQAYQRALAAGARFAQTNPGMMMPPKLPGLKDGIISVPGSGSEDKYPAMLAAGEAVIPAKQNKKYAPLIAGIIADSIPGYKRGIKSIAERTTNVPMYGDLAVRFQSSGENRSQLASVPNLAEILAPLTARIGEARGLGFSQSTQQTAYPSIIEEFTPLVENFINRVQQEFDATAETISSTSERLARAYQTAGASMDNELSQINNDIERGVVKKAFGVDPDSYGTIAANFRASHGFGGRAGRYPEGNIPTSYTDPQFKKAAGAAYERISGQKPTDMDIGHVFDIKTREKLGLPTTIALEELRNDVQTSRATLNALNSSIEKAEQEVANKISEAGNVVKQAGKKIGNSAIEGVAEGTGSQSASIKARQQGQNVVDGFEQGILEGMDDAALAGQKVSSSAANAMGSSKTGPIAAGATPVTGSTNLIPSATKSLNKFNNTLMSASFALSSLSGITYLFADGPMAKFSGTISKLTGIFFALMSITQLLTQAQFTRLVAERAATAGLLTKTVVGDTVKFSRTTGLFAGGIKNLLPNLLKFGRMLARFAGIPGAIIGGFLFVKKLIDAGNKAREKEIKAINGLADAATLTQDKLNTLGGIFGITPQKTPFETDIQQVKSTPQQRGLIDLVKQSEDFKKDFADDIEELSKATAKEAELTFKTLAIDLAGRGFGTDQIQAIIDALREEAGKTDVVIDVKSFKLNTDAGQAELEKTAKDIISGFTNAFKTGFSMQEVLIQGVSDGHYYSFYKDQLMPTIELQKQAAASGQQLSNIMNGLSGQLRNGTITAKTFNKSFSLLEKQMIDFNKSNPEAAIMMLNSAIETLPKKVQKAMEGIDGLSDKLLVMRAQSLGLTTIIVGLADAIKILQKPPSQGGDVSTFVQAQLNLEKYKNLINATAKEIEELFKDPNKKGNGKKGFLQEEIEALQNQIAAYKELRKMRVDAGTASELAGNKEYASLLKTADGVKKVIAQIREYSRLKKDLEKIEIAGAGIGDFELALLNMRNAAFDLQEQLVKMKYSNQLEKDNKQLTIEEENLAKIEDKLSDIEQIDIRPLQDQIDKNADTLEKISFSEDKINEKYDKQEETLSRIQEIQEEINTLQKSRISIADALTRGDIAAAAQAVQDLRAQQSTIQQNREKRILDNARKQQIDALGRNKLEKENKDLQEKILKIQIEKVREVEKEKRTIEDTIESIRRRIRTTQFKIFVDTTEAFDKLSSLFGMTKTQIENAISALNLAKAAGININDKEFLHNILAAAKGDAEAINTLLGETPGKVLLAIAELVKLRAEMNLPTVLDPRLKSSLPIQKADASCPSGFAYYIVRYEDTDGTGAKKVGEERIGCVPGGAIVVTVPTPTTASATVPIPTTTSTTTTGSAGVVITAGPTSPTFTTSTPGTITAGPTSPTFTTSTPGTITAGPTSPTFAMPGTMTAGPTSPTFTTSTPGTMTAGPISPTFATTTIATVTVGPTSPTFIAPITTTTKIIVTTSTAGPTSPTFVTTTTTTLNISGGGGGGMLMLASGGMVKPKYFAKGAIAKGTDTVPAMLTPGEFVVRKYAVNNFGEDNLKAINNGSYDGGSVYNYNLNVNVESGANPDDIARTVIMKIKQLDSQRIKGQRY